MLCSKKMVVSLSNYIRKTCTPKRNQNTTIIYCNIYTTIQVITKISIADTLGTLDLPIKLLNVDRYCVWQTRLKTGNFKGDHENRHRFVNSKTVYFSVSHYCMVSCFDKYAYQLFYVLQAIKLPVFTDKAKTKNYKKNARNQSTEQEVAILILSHERVAKMTSVKIQSVSVSTKNIPSRY